MNRVVRCNTPGFAAAFGSEGSGVWQRKGISCAYDLKIWRGGEGGGSEGIEEIHYKGIWMVTEDSGEHLPFNHFRTTSFLKGEGIKLS